MDRASRILSDITVHMKYAKYVSELERRENWNELVTRNKKMHIKKYPYLRREIAGILSVIRSKDGPTL